MRENNKTYSRRCFGKLALGGLPIACVPFFSNATSAQTKPNSIVQGIQVGTIIAYSFHNMPDDALSLLGYLLEVGLSACETHCEPFEYYAGMPKPPPRPVLPEISSGLGPQINQPRTRPRLTPKQIAADKVYSDAIIQWRLNAPMGKIAEIGKRYNDAGVRIYAYKVPLAMEMPDGVFDYAFRAARLLGCSQVTMEMPDHAELTQRVGEFASKHKMMVGYHAHLQATPTLWDVATSQSPYNGINLDVGHYTSAGNHDVINFIRNNHKRITSIHLKDRKFPEHGGQNMPWGEGDTPLVEVLHLMRNEKYPFPATIELEYPIPPGSNSIAEVAKCLAYVRKALA